MRGRRAGAASWAAAVVAVGFAKSVLLDTRAVLRLAAVGSFSSPNAGAGTAAGLTYSPCPKTWVDEEGREEEE